MRKKLFIVIIVLLLLATCIFFVFKNRYTRNKEDNKVEFEPHYFIEYAEEHDNMDIACITFYHNGEYTLFDCDSEPSHYPFDSEWNCKYELENDEIHFTCPDSEDTTIKLTRWSEGEFYFIYEGKEHFFKTK